MYSFSGWGTLILSANRLIIYPILYVFVKSHRIAHPLISKISLTRMVNNSVLSYVFSKAIEEKLLDCNGLSA